MGRTSIRPIGSNAGQNCANFIMVFVLNFVRKVNFGVSATKLPS